MLPQIIERVKRKSGLGGAIEKELEQMPISNWKKVGGVVEINDSNQPFFIPTNCLLTQAAVRQNNIVYYDGFIFQRLSERNKLALVLHELIYKLSGHTSSVETRKLVGLVLSEDEWDQLDYEQAKKLTKTVGNFSYPEVINGVTYWLKSKYDSLDDLHEITFDSQVEIEWDGFHISTNSAEIRHMELLSEGKFLSINGTIKELGMKVNTKLKFSRDRDGEKLYFFAYFSNKFWIENFMLQTQKKHP